MKTLEFITIPVDGKIVFDVPTGWEERELLLKVMEYEADPRDWAKLSGEERLKVLKRFAGTAKFPNIETDKYKVYAQ